MQTYRNECKKKPQTDDEEHNDEEHVELGVVEDVEKRSLVRYICVSKLHPLQCIGLVGVGIPNRQPGLFPSTQDPCSGILYRRTKQIELHVLVQIERKDVEIEEDVLD